MPPPKKAEPFYLSHEWRRLIGSLIRMHGRICQKCGKTRDEHGDPIRIYGDHIIELKDGGELLNPSNVQLLCGSCHTKKTIAARAQRSHL